MHVWHFFFFPPLSPFFFFFFFVFFFFRRPWASRVTFRSFCPLSLQVESPGSRRARLQLVWQFEKRLLIVDDVQVLNAGPHLGAVHPDHLVAWERARTHTHTLVSLCILSTQKASFFLFYFFPFTQSVCKTVAWKLSSVRLQCLNSAVDGGICLTIRDVNGATVHLQLLMWGSWRWIEKRKFEKWKRKKKKDSPSWSLWQCRIILTVSAIMCCSLERQEDTLEWFCYDLGLNIWINNNKIK